MSNTKRGTLNIIGCGGFGINVTKFFEKDANSENDGYATIKPIYIDTSRSNLEENIAEDRVFILEGVDGSGKVRRENHAAIAENVRMITQKYPPADFNIVVFSASGGSGSVFGPMILAELLRRGASAVAVVAGSEESAITAQNTLNTLKSLENIAKNTDSPVVIRYEHNSTRVKRSQIDSNCRATIGALSILTSRQNREMDTMDIANWVRYNRSTSAEPRLSLLTLETTNADAEEKSLTAISVASLYTDTDADQAELSPEYSTVGYPRHTVRDLSVAHFLISLERVPSLVKMIEERIADLGRNVQARKTHASIVSDSDSSTGDLIL